MSTRESKDPIFVRNEKEIFHLVQLSCFTIMLSFQHHFVLYSRHMKKTFIELRGCTAMKTTMRRLQNRILAAPHRTAKLSPTIFRQALSQSGESLASHQCKKSNTEKPSDTSSEQRGNPQSPCRPKGHQFPKKITIYVGNKLKITETMQQLSFLKSRLTKYIYIAYPYPYPSVFIYFRSSIN